MSEPLLIREVSTQPAQPSVSGCRRRCTSSQRPERCPGRHFPDGPQIASDARTNDMPSESCRGPRSGVPLTTPSPFYATEKNAALTAVPPGSVSTLIWLDEHGQRRPTCQG